MSAPIFTTKGRTMSRTCRYGLALGLTAIAVAAAAPAAAEAAQYDVSSCRTSAGLPAPVGDAAGNGWQPVAGGSNPGLVTADSCASGGGLYAAVNLNYASAIGDYAAWQFFAPADTSITSYDMRWAYQVHRNSYVGTSPSSGTAGGVRVYSQGQDLLDQASQASGSSVGSLANPASMSRSNIDTPTISLVASCTAPLCSAEPGAINAALTLYRSRVTLLDQSSPRLGGPGGEAVDRPTWAGGETVTFTANDAGGGVYRLLTKVDGNTLVEQVVDPTSTRCVDADASNTQPYEFLHARPCPLTTSGDTTIDTRSLPEGAHSIRLVVEDAAGNQTTLYGPVSKTIDNIPAPSNVIAPSVGGSAAVPRTLVGNKGDWSLHGLEATYDYQWLRCDAGGNGCTDIPGATGPSHDLSGSDAYRRLVLRVRASTAEGSAVASSAPSAIVADAAGNTTAPGGTTGDSQGASVSSSGLGQVVSPAGVADAVGRGAPNGDNASDSASLKAFFDRNRARSLTTVFGRRVVVRGRLVDEAGRPIANARIEHLSRTATAGATAVDKGGARTRQDGTWTLIMPANVSSRELTFRYRSHLGDEKAAAEQQLTLRVKAAAKLRITPRVTNNGKTIRFSGSLRGRPIPIRGKLVELQARDAGRGRWITFKSLRSSRGGSFRARYTFRRTRGPVTYEFRARIRYEGTYPFLAGTSNKVRVRVR